MSAGDRLDGALRTAREEGRAALIGYLPAGFPTARAAVDAALAMAGSGVDVVELGLPYSDPVMDGPVIQRAATAALAGGATTETVLESVAEIAAAGVPVLVMTYWNPVERYGVERFARRLAEVGGSGLITPDLIPEEADDTGWTAESDRRGLRRVHLVAPSSSPERLALTARASTGFVYAAALMGVTGTGGALTDVAHGLVSRVREVRADLPVCVGLGVSTAEQAAAIGQAADGVIVGAAFVRRLAEARNAAEGVAAVARFAAELARGVRGDG
ncbi:tryptophan synthase subunit alpha [Saccharothrix sp. Mg75]|uniref:tryptophan synthase subunit alpha n=1 Tax=Saccharothrix sp. Mg75 TaxID=3445357 RepID=UPI003EED6AD1